ncbi:hypothetical protein AAVH_13422 [Aphelenchoides avenae]|nr:hypothetical protein AAVH_13422 [Aphelenchus avenae]
MCSVSWRDDDAPLPSQFSLPNPATVDNIFGVNRFGASLWTDASQGSQRLPVRVTQAPEQRGPVRQEHVRRDCVEYLRAFVKNPSQYEADDAPSQAAASRSETATPPYASFSMEAADCIANANSQPTAVASKRPAVADGEIPAKFARLVEDRIEAAQAEWKEELENVKRAQQKQSRALVKKQAAENAYERTENNEIQLNRRKLSIGRLGAGWMEKVEQGVLSAKEVFCKILTEAFNQKYTATHIEDAEVRWSKWIKSKRTEVIATFNRRDQRDEVLDKFKKQQRVYVTTPGTKQSCKINIWEMLTEREKFVRKAAVATVTCLNLWRKAKVDGHPSTDAELSGHSHIVVNGKGGVQIKTHHYEEWHAELKLLVSRDGFKDGPLGSNQHFSDKVEFIGLASTVAKRLPFMTAEERESYDLPPYTA